MLPPLYLSAPVAVAEPHCWECATGDRHVLEPAFGVSGTTEKDWTHCPEPRLLGAKGRTWGRDRDHPNIDHSQSPTQLGHLPPHRQSHSPSRLLPPLVNTWRHHGGQELPCSCHELWREAGVQVLLVTCGAVAMLEGKGAKLPLLPHPPAPLPPYSCFQRSVASPWYSGTCVASRVGSHSYRTML